MSPPSPSRVACRVLIALSAALLPAACIASPLDTPPMRFDGVDACGRETTTDSAEAQAWFDQGLTLLYGFNHDEAARSFHAATLADPGYSMGWWGLAMASGADINNPTVTASEGRRAHDCARKAVDTAGDASPVERALAEAVAVRFSRRAPDDRSELDRAYADAMAEVRERFPQDPEVGTAFAESLMILQPWDYWDADGQPKGRIEEAVAALQDVLRQHPGHAGAAHFLVHALEAGRPADAEAAADVLADAVPGSGHLLHMPSHIYVHLGRYADGSDCNEAAVAADEAYMERALAPGNYRMYSAHNLHMLAFCAMMEAREGLARQAAADLVARIPEEAIRAQVEWIDGLMMTPVHVAIRFGRWQDVLAVPEPPAWRLASRANWHYGRGVALSATGRVAEARAEQAAFEAVAAEIPEGWFSGGNRTHEVLALARQMLEGEILWREGDARAAFAALREGVRLEDQLVYDEPPGWMQPVRHALGALLMADGRAAEAEGVYRADLRRHPGNGWSLLGLEQAVRVQGRTIEADSVARRRAEAWARSDVNAGSSCFCEPGVPTT